VTAVLIVLFLAGMAVGVFGLRQERRAKQQLDARPTYDDMASALADDRAAIQHFNDRRAAEMYE
jgi:hypothetical protein